MLNKLLKSIILPALTAAAILALAACPGDSNDENGNEAMTVPGAPTNVMATPGDAEATVEWTAPASNGGSPITSYRVTASPGDVSPMMTADGNTTQLILTGLTNDTAYTFTVIATNALGDSAASEPSNEVTPVLTVASVPGAPTNVMATAGNAEATVSWTAPASDGSSPITSYTVTASPGDVSPMMTADGNTLQLTIRGLTNDTAYTFTVIATNAVGNSPASTPSTGVTPMAGLNSSPLAFTLADQRAVSGASFSYTFDPVTDPDGDTVTYAADLSDGSSLPAWLSFNGATRTFSGTPTAGDAGELTVRVTATDDGSPPLSSMATFVLTVVATVPGTPTNVTARAGDALATVEWTAPASDGGSPITSYTVTVNPGNATADGNTTQLIIRGLTNGTAYTFTVMATNAAGDSAASAPSDEVTPMAGLNSSPPAVTLTDQTAFVDNRLEYQFSAVTDPDGDALTYAADLPDGGSLPAWLSFNGATRTFSGTPTAGDAATLTVRVTVTDDGSPPKSSMATFVLTIADIPGVPTNVMAVAGIGEATVSWTAPAGSVITSYRVTGNPGDVSEVTRTVDGNTTQLTIEGLNLDTVYTFMVVAINGAGESPASVPSNGVTLITPPPDRVVSIAGQNGAEPETHGQIFFRVEQRTLENLTVNFSLSGGSGVTQDDLDFPLDEDLNETAFCAGSDECNLFILIKDDLLAESTETVTVTINSVMLGDTMLSLPSVTPTVTLTIADNDTGAMQPTAVESITHINDEGLEGGDFDDDVQFQITLDEPATGRVNITYRLSGGPEVTDADFIPFGPPPVSMNTTTSCTGTGTTCNFFIDEIADDTVVEGTETVTLTIVSVSHVLDTNTLMLPSAGLTDTFTITDNDDP